VVLDNLNTHTYLALVETFGKEESGSTGCPIVFSLHVAAWLVAEHGRNRIEHPIRQCLKCRLPDEWTLGLEIIAWEIGAINSRQKSTGVFR